MIIEGFILALPEHYSALRVFISGLFGVMPFFSMAIITRLVNREFSAEMSRLLRKTFYSWLLSLIAQTASIVLFPSNTSVIFILAILFVSTIGTFMVINCGIVSIAANVYERPIWTGKEVYSNLSCLDMIFMTISLSSIGFVKIPKELYFRNIIDLYVKKKDLPRLDRKLMTKEESRGTPITDSEVKELEEAPEKRKIGNKIWAHASELSSQARRRSALLILIITAIGVVMSYR